MGLFTGALRRSLSIRRIVGGSACLPVPAGQGRGFRPDRTPHFPHSCNDCVSYVG